MTFEQWLAANGYKAEALTESNRKHLMAAYQAEVNPPKKAEPITTDWDVATAKAKANAERVEQIRAIAGEALTKYAGNRSKIERIEAMTAAATADEKCSLDSFKYQLLLEDRNYGPIISVPQKAQETPDVIEAAVCVQHGLKDVEKVFSDQTLQAARDRFRHGIRLSTILRKGAQANGFRGEDSDCFTLARYAMKSRDNDDGYGMRSDVGPSTGIQVPGILSNIANKFIAPAFLFTEQSWRQVAKISTVNDFKTKTTYRMTGANTYRKVAKGGEIKHGALAELSYTDKAETYGILLGVSREDMINDDLSAFANLSAQIGQGAGDVLNNIFWSVWLDDSTFFPTNGSNNNYDAGATDSVLSYAGLENAEAIFNNQTKPNGAPLGATARVLLVPTSLGATSRSLMQSQLLNLATSSVATIGQANIWQGKFTPVESRYLSKTSLPDGDGVSQTVTGSSTAWYLLADPNDIAAISVVFLFGRDMPTVETSDFEFDRLGIATRAYFDFGVQKHEYRAAVKLKGAA